MSKSTCHSHLSSATTTPDLDISSIQLQNLLDFRNQTTTNDKLFTNINYVRNVLRKLFGSHSNSSRRSSSRGSTICEDNLNDQTLTIDNSISPILIHSCLQYDKHEKFSGRIN